MKGVSGSADDKQRRVRDSMTPTADRPATTRDDANDSRAFASGVGEVIRRERLAHKWTQAALAEHAGLSPNYVARLERGELGPSLFVARRIAEALGISIDMLANFTPTRAARRRDSMVARRVREDGREARDARDEEEEE